MDKKKPGRKADDLKTNVFKIRISDSDLQKLNFSAKTLGITKSDVMRIAIRTLYERVQTDFK